MEPLAVTKTHNVPNKEGERRSAPLVLFFCYLETCRFGDALDEGTRACRPCRTADDPCCERALTFDTLASNCSIVTFAPSSRTCFASAFRLRRLSSTACYR